MANENEELEEELEDYESNYTGQEIDNAILKVRTPDSTPTENSDKLITSGAVYAAIQAAIVQLTQTSTTEGENE